MSVEIIDKRTPELKLLNIIETQVKNIKTLYEDFKIGKINLEEAILKAKGIGGTLTIADKFISKGSKIIKTKKCSKCGKVKNIENFYYRKRSPDKYQSWCKYCMQVYNGEKYKRRAQE